MIATNHTLTGAVVALAVKQPSLALPLAFVSHFAIDALPHFGLAEQDVFKRNQNNLFKSVTAADVILFVAALALTSVWLSDVISIWLLLACMLLAYLPDLAWLYRYLIEVKTGRWRPEGWFNRFHKLVQWCERPWGLVVELAWLIAMIILIFLLSS